MLEFLTLFLLSTPLVLDSTNTEVSFEVDSTWHLIHGEAKELSGKIWFEREGEPESGKLEIRFPVNSFDTDNSSRDERLRQVMASSQFPDVVFHGEKYLPGCKLESLADGQSCNGKLLGKIKIRETEAPLELHVTTTKKGLELLFHGQTALEWERFGVEDPSILIAKLKNRVEIAVDVRLPMNRLQPTNN